MLLAKVHLVEPLGAYDIVDITTAIGPTRACAARTHRSQFVRAQGDAVWLGARRRPHALLRQAQRPVAAPPLA